MSEMHENMAQGTATAVARKPPSRQVAHCVESRRGVTLIQYRRIVDQLKAGSPEAKIAEREGVSVSLVRQVRALALDQGDRQMAAVGVGVGRFLDAVRQMHRDIEEGILQELQEGAA